MLKTAIILAGGFGTRLQSVVNDVPKPMAPINGEPFLNYQLDYLKYYGVKKVILSVGYLAEKIQEYYKSNYNELEIEYVVEHSPLGTGGGIRLALEKCSDKLVLILNGDSFFNIDLLKLECLHKMYDSEFSLALRRVSDASRYGTVKTNETNRIISFQEKKGEQKKGTINGGVYILNKKIYLTHTEEKINFSIEKDFFEKKLTKHNIKGFEFNGYFIDIGIPEDYEKAQHDFKKFKYR